MAVAIKELEPTINEVSMNGSKVLDSMGNRIKLYMETHVIPQGEALRPYIDRENAGRQGMKEIDVIFGNEFRFQTSLEEAAITLWAVEQMSNNGKA